MLIRIDERLSVLQRTIEDPIRGLHARLHAVEDRHFKADVQAQVFKERFDKVYSLVFGNGTKETVLQQIAFVGEQVEGLERSVQELQTWLDEAELDDIKKAAKIVLDEEETKAGRDRRVNTWLTGLSIPLSIMTIQWFIGFISRIDLTALVRILSGSQ